MDFFEAQDRARRNTGKLVLFYILAVIGIVVSIYFVTMALYKWQFADFGHTGWWSPGWFLSVSLIVLCTIAIGTLFRVSQLRKGGSAVAELLGGRRVDPSTTNQNERRLMNIVEEMSIASGMPVPDVYVLDGEENINAFAAGFNTSDAAVGVTRGALEQLTRDELQGVIAHEFSHIFNGDMRFNIRLIGVLNGILLIHVMGMIVMRSVMYSGGTRVRSRSGGKDGGGNAAIVIIIAGLSLVVIGYIGMIFGRMIQAAISRQREYLADAAAVQYTRNPDGLAGALSKIGAKRKGAEIKDGHAMEMSHLFFASSFHSALDRLYSTHPPVDKRIKAINPSFEGSEGRRRRKIQKQFEKDHVSGSKAAAASGGGPVSGHAALTPEVILAAIGTLDSGNVQRAGRMLEQIPAELKNAAHEPFSAEALIYAMLFATDKKEKDELPEWFGNEAGDAMSKETKKLKRLLDGADRNWFLPLADLAHGSLRGMTKDQYMKFHEIIQKAVSGDITDNLFGFTLEKIVDRKLKMVFDSSRIPDVKHHHLKSIGKELELLISALAHASGKDSEEAWKAGMEPIAKVAPEGMKLLQAEECTLEALDNALDELAMSANPVKKYIMSSVIYTITADKKVTTEEKELVRGISEALDCPIPMGALGG
jgi:Zn-dependent protease with chaperone function